MKATEQLVKESKNLGLDKDKILFSRIEKKLFQANTEPSLIGNNHEGVETRAESLRQTMFAMTSKFHEMLPSLIAGRYSPISQETVRSEDKELHDNKNVIYAPLTEDRGHEERSSLENSVNCGKLRGISEYSQKDYDWAEGQINSVFSEVTMSECGQSAAKLSRERRFNDCNQKVSNEIVVQSDLYSDVERQAEMTCPLTLVKSNNNDIPLFATPTLVTADLKAQKGFLSSAGFKVINAGLFTYGDITNLS